MLKDLLPFQSSWKNKYRPTNSVERGLSSSQCKFFFVNNDFVPIATFRTRADFAAYEYLCRQSEAKEWVETIIGEKFPENDLWKCLGDGVALCKLANIMWPGSVSKFNGPQSYSFLLIENISKFLTAVENSGLMKGEQLFSAIDLFEKKNMPHVINSLFKLAEQAEKKGFKIKWKKTRNVDFSPKEIQEAKKLEGVNLWGTVKKSKNLSLVRTYFLDYHHSNFHNFDSLYRRSN